MSCLMSQSCVRGCCYVLCRRHEEHQHDRAPGPTASCVSVYPGLVNPGQCAISLGEISLCWPFYSQIEIHETKQHPVSIKPVNINIEINLPDLASRC